MKYMVFLNWIDDVLERAFDIIGGFFNVIWSFLCSIIYGLITLMFNIFTKLTQMDILDAGNININGIYQRMTMIITIIMIFYITFEFIKYVLQPDTINDKEKGAEGIIKRIVIAILLIAFIPTVFTTAMKLQDKILETNVIPKVIFGQKDFDYKNAGSNFSGDVFAAFYRVNYENCQPNCQNAEKKVDSVIKSWKERQGLAALAKANAYEIIDIDNSIQFDGLLAVIFGCFALYVIFLYCIDMGVRFVQLLFLQIIAPVAAISYIIPQKESMLNKWIKQVTTTYVDVFIRYAVLYFMLLIMSILSSSLDFYELSRNGKQITIWLYIFIIMGLLIFVQRAPKLIEELLPKSSGAASIGFGFSGKSRFEPLGKTISSFLKPTTATAGMVAGATKGVLKKDANGKYRLNKDLVKNIKGNKFKDILARGATYATSMAKAGYQGAKTGAKTGRFSQANLAAQQSVQKDEAIVNKGGSVLGATFKGTHYQEVKADIQVKIDELEAITKAKESAASTVKNMKIMKTMESYITDWINRGIGDASTREKAKKDIEKASRVYSVSNRDAAAEDAFNKAIESAVKSVYNINLPTHGPYNEKQQEAASVIQNLKGNMELGSVKWDTVKVAMDEATRISTGREIKLEVPKKDANGNIMHDANNNVITEIVTKIVGKDASDTEFAEKIGDVSDTAEYEVARLKSEETTRMAEANAAESKK